VTKKFSLGFYPIFFGRKSLLKFKEPLLPISIPFSFSIGFLFCKKKKCVGTEKKKRFPFFTFLFARFVFASVWRAARIC
jgi:hypothetical protein